MTASGRKAVLLVTRFGQVRAQCPLFSKADVNTL